MITFPIFLISVDIYGKCSYIYGQNNQCSKSLNCEDIFKPYKFNLAFENGVCTDYISEKFWITLQRNSVPVVLSRDCYSADVIPPASFIRVKDFPSVKALAEYLLHLDKNDTAYNEYFSRRQKFVSRRNQFNFKACKVCNGLHDGRLKPSVYYDMFKTFWNDDVDEKSAEIRRCMRSTHIWFKSLNYFIHRLSSPVHCKNQNFYINNGSLRDR